jgi:hypothetical protein
MNGSPAAQSHGGNLLQICKRFARAVALGKELSRTVIIFHRVTAAPSHEGWEATIPAFAVGATANHDHDATSNFRDKFSTACEYPSVIHVPVAVKVDRCRKRSATPQRQP